MQVKEVAKSLYLVPTQTKSRINSQNSSGYYGALLIPVAVFVGCMSVRESNAAAAKTGSVTTSGVASIRMALEIMMLRPPWHCGHK